MLRRGTRAILISTILLGACSAGQPATTDNVTQSDQVANGETQAVTAGDPNLELDGEPVTDNGNGIVGNGAWEISDFTDPMSDEATHTATRMFEGESYDVQVQVKCANNSKLSYDFRTFDKQGNPAPMVLLPSMHMGQLIRYQLRIDEAPPRYMMTRAQNNNQVVFNAVAGSNGPGGATNLALRFNMEGGEATISFDQMDEGLKTVLQPCLSGQDSKTPAAALPAEPPSDGAPQ